MKKRIYLRDLFWLTIVAALSLVIVVDRQQMESELLEQAIKSQRELSDLESQLASSRTRMKIYEMSFQALQTTSTDHLRKNTGAIGPP